MKQQSNIITKPICGESFFGPIPKYAVPLDPLFVSLDKSLIWYLNYLFWKHFTLWGQTYGEHYEASLPSGVSEAHKDSFIEASVNKFIKLLLRLEKENNLPEEIRVLEQGPGTGVYAQKFLDILKQYSETNNKPFYKNIRYIISDTSEEILQSAKKTLRNHSDHIEVAIIDATNTKQIVENPVLFARHSNVWDQFPSRIVEFNEGKIFEIFVQAVSNHPFRSSGEKTEVRGKTKRDIEQFILHNPAQWKSLIRSVKLKTKKKLLDQDELTQFPYVKTMQTLAKHIPNKQEMIVSKGVLDNIQQLLQSLDWERNGYAEIVDIVVPTIEGFQKDRRPKKYDGSTANVVNGPLIKTFLRQKNKHVRFDKIRGINHTITMRNHNLKTLLEAQDFLTIGEIAARKDESIKQLKEHAESMFSMGIDAITFSDQAFQRSYYFKQKDLIESHIFSQLPGEALLPVLKTRNKTWEEIQNLTSQMKQQGVKNLFIVTGDPGMEKEITHDSIEITKKLKNDFFIGGVANANVKHIPKMLNKIAAGTQFFITQATYDESSFDTWVEEIKKLELHKKIPIIAALVPIISKRTLSVLQFIDDMSVSQDVIKRFEHLEKDELRTEGIQLAKDMITKYKELEIFSGIYIYSKSPAVIAQIMDFPYYKNKTSEDSL